GMGSFFSGVARVPITATVIVFELTHDFNVFLPLLMGSMVAYVVAEKLYPGSIYDRLLSMNDDAKESHGAKQALSGPQS
ncbi:MAG TPA: chloride channel protein, partial [Candidatus Obscuribacterales bacterium]